MNILVCVKQVPGSNNVEVDPVTGVLKRNGVQSKINPYDLYAIETALSLAERFGVRIPSFGHAGDGNLHIYICRDELPQDKWEKTLSACFDCMYKKAEELGGLVSGEHGIGYAKKEFLKRQYGETPIQLMQGIKKVFDPKNILNPNKICF